MSQILPIISALPASAGLMRAASVKKIIWKNCTAELTVALPMSPMP
jgi:hypothetical protein